MRFPATDWTIRLRMLLFGLAGAGFTLAVVGGPTDVVPNPWFTRMTPVRTQDYVFLALTVMLGALLAASYAAPRTAGCSIQQGKTFTGGVLSVLAVGCPVCNKIVLLLLGTSGALTYFEPIQPVLGLLSVGLMAAAVWMRWRPALRPQPSSMATA